MAVSRRRYHFRVSVELMAEILRESPMIAEYDELHVPSKLVWHRQMH